jgi:hypothetical protein
MLKEIAGAITGVALAVSGSLVEAEDVACDVSQDNSPQCETVHALADAHEAQDALESIKEE